eukprot:COSAG02_NODE_12951_length_1468_cov_1.202337_2_plen_63_part_01
MMHASTGRELEQVDCKSLWACGCRLDDAAVTTRVQSVATGGVTGYETYQIVLELSPSAENVYS